MSPRARTQAGFTIIEVLIAAAVGMIVFFALATMQVNLGRENLAVSQKIEMNDFSRLLAQLLADENLCQCTVAPATLQTGPVDPASGQPTLQGGLAQLNSACPSVKLAAVGDKLPVGTKSLTISSISVTGLTPVSTTTSATANVYGGFVEVRVADPAGAPAVQVRSMAPVRVPKKFFVSGNHITSCGASEQEYVVRPGVLTTSDLTATKPVTANCPGGMIAVAGGWRNENGPVPPNCKAHYAAVLTNAPSANGTGWDVLVLCHSYTPFVTCYKPSFAVGP